MSYYKQIEHSIRENKNIGGGTKKSYLETLKNFHEFAGEHDDISFITMDVLHAYESWMYKQSKRFSSVFNIKLRAKAVKSFTSLLVGADPSLNAPLKTSIPKQKHIDSPIDLSSTTRPFTREELIKIFEYEPGDNMVCNREELREKMIMNRAISHKLLLFQLMTGMAAIDVATFELDKHLVNPTLISKTRVKRLRNSNPTPADIPVYPMTSEIIEWFVEKQEAKYYPRGQFNFFPIGTINQDESNTHIGSSVLSGRYKLLAKEIGIPVIASHMARRTAASVLFSGGVGFSKIMRFLGDDTAEIVNKRYVARQEYDFSGIYEKYYTRESKADKINRLILELPKEERNLILA